MRRLALDVTPGRLAVAQLAPDEAVPAWALDVRAAAPLASITRTGDELSIVCAEDAVPEAARAERGWRALALRGPFPFGETGVLASVARPLAEAGVPIFALATFDTDWVLVKEADLERAIAALTAAGHDVTR